MSFSWADVEDPPSVRVREVNGAIVMHPSRARGMLAIVAPYVDQAIAAEATKHPGLVVAGPKFYVGDCSWWSVNGAGRGPHFVPNGMPALQAQKIADYYDSGTCASPWCVP